MIVNDNVIEAALAELPSDTSSLREIRYYIDLLRSEPAIAKVQLVARSPTISVLSGARYICEKCGYYVYRILDKPVAGKCPHCRQGNLVIAYKEPRKPDIVNVIFRKAKVLIELYSEARREHIYELLDAILVGEETVSLNAGQYTAVVIPVQLREKKTSLSSKPVLVIRRILDNTGEEDGNYKAKLMEIILSQSDIFSRLQLLAEAFGAGRIYGLLAERQLVLSVVVGAGPFLPGERWWLNCAIIGDPGTAKSLMAKLLMDVVPGRRVIYLTGGAQTVAGLLLGAQGGSVTEGPVLLLSGDYKTFGVLILDEAHEIKKEIWDELKAPMEDGIYGRATAVTGPVTRAACTAIIAIANWSTGVLTRLPASLPDFMASPALQERFDIQIFMLEYDSETIDRILELKLEQVVSGIKPSHIRYYLERAREVVPEIRKSDRLKKKWKEAREEYAAALSQLYQRNMDVVRVGLAVLRVAYALAKLAMWPAVEPGLVEYAGRLLVEQIEKVLQRKHESKIRPGLSTLVNTVYDTLLRFYDRGIVLVPKETLIEEVAKQLEKEYLVYRDDIERAIEVLKQRGEVYEPEPGKIRLVWAQ